jgi:hypothetical protein
MGIATPLTCAIGFVTAPVIILTPLRASLVHLSGYIIPALFTLAGGDFIRLRQQNGNEYQKGKAGAVERLVNDRRSGHGLDLLPKSLGAGHGEVCPPCSVTSAAGIDGHNSLTLRQIPDWLVRNLIAFKSQAILLEIYQHQMQSCGGVLRHAQIEDLAEKTGDLVFHAGWPS